MQKKFWGFQEDAISLKFALEAVISYKAQNLGHYVHLRYDNIFNVWKKVLMITM